MAVARVRGYRPRTNYFHGGERPKAHIARLQVHIDSVDEDIRAIQDWLAEANRQAEAKIAKARRKAHTALMTKRRLEFMVDEKGHHDRRKEAEAKRLFPIEGEDDLPVKRPRGRPRKDGLPPMQRTDEERAAAAQMRPARAANKRGKKAPGSRSAVKPARVAPEATALEAAAAEGIEPIVLEPGNALLPVVLASDVVVSEPEAVEPEVVVEPEPEVGFRATYETPAVSQRMMDLLTSMNPHHPNDLSEMNEMELLGHIIDNPPPVKVYPDLFTDEQLAELDAQANPALLPAEYDITWADHWPEDPNEFQPEMHAEFLNFGFPAMPYARSLTREEAKAWFEGMTEHQARHWLGSIIFPSPYDGPAVSPTGRWHSRENTVTDMKWEIALQNFGNTARRAALPKYQQIEELRLPEARRQLFWEDVIHRRTTIKNLMRQVTWGMLTVDQMRREVFRTDHDLMIALCPVDVELYCARMLDKLPWPPGLSRIELAAEFGRWEADHFQDMSAWWRPPYGLFLRDPLPPMAVYKQYTPEMVNKLAVKDHPSDPDEVYEGGDVSDLTVWTFDNPHKTVAEFCEERGIGPLLIPPAKWHR